MVKIQDQTCHKEGSCVLKIGFMKMLKSRESAEQSTRKLNHSLITVLHFLSHECLHWQRKPAEIHESQPSKSPTKKKNIYTNYVRFVKLVLD